VLPSLRIEETLREPCSDASRLVVSLATSAAVEASVAPFLRRRLLIWSDMQ
jgi:hypothetical protein